MEDLVWMTYRKRHCDESGVPSIPMDFESFRNELLAAHPGLEKELKVALEKFDKDCCIEILKHRPRTETGDMRTRSAARQYLKSLRTDLNNKASKKALFSLQNDRIAAKALTATLEQPSKAIAPTIAAIHVLESAETMRTTNPAKLPPLPDSLRLSSLLASTPDPENSDMDMKHSENVTTSTDDTVSGKLKHFGISSEVQPPEIEVGDKVAAQRKGPDFLQLGKLLSDRQMSTTKSFLSSANERSIRQAPLLAADLVAEHYKDLVPQYGLLGSLEDEENLTSRQLFLNTNVPFSTFICGVQGSGKSHTTACILENAVLSSPYIGHLESPVSTLIFSYGEWSSGGAGFSISEATFLGASHPNFPGRHVKQITVLHSPSNAAIKKLYERIPNVKTMPFKLKAQKLDIRALHALMAVDEKSTMPLYMTTVEAILRQIASKSHDGSLNYVEFKRKLAKEKFDSTQRNMLKLRTNLLESFLDLDGTAPELDFKPGEVNIIDLSDAFLTPNTACILFKLGLEQFLQSRAPGKMIVLDEAHKYMLDTPGSKMLTEHLTRVIRLQRHQGARVIISTQEPTIATELIALCSVTVMHRFTSPTWYAALKRHINAVGDDKTIMQQIESLETGEALVYAPNAVLRKNDAGNLVKAIGRLLKVNIRNRVTLDGGASVMAV